MNYDFLYKNKNKNINKHNLEISHKKNNQIIITVQTIDNKIR